MELSLIFLCFNFIDHPEIHPTKTPTMWMRPKVFRPLIILITCLRIKRRSEHASNYWGRVSDEQDRLSNRTDGSKICTKKSGSLLSGCAHGAPFVILPRVLMGRAGLLKMPSPDAYTPPTFPRTKTGSAWLRYWDLHSRQSLGWSLQPNMQTSLLKDAQLMAQGKNAAWQPRLSTPKFRGHLAQR